MSECSGKRCMPLPGDRRIASVLRYPRPLVVLVWLAMASQARAETTFATDVMAVLSKAGCNMGVCHGNQNGKGGFKLSLRGQDPDFDFLALSREQLGRRVDPLQPEAQLDLAEADGSSRPSRRPPLRSRFRRVPHPARLGRRGHARHAAQCTTVGPDRSQCRPKPCWSSPRIAYS